MTSYVPHDMLCSVAQISYPSRVLANQVGLPRGFGSDIVLLLAVVAVRVLQAASRGLLIECW